MLNHVQPRRSLGFPARDEIEAARGEGGVAAKFLIVPQQAFEIIVHPPVIAANVSP